MNLSPCSPQHYYETIQILCQWIGGVNGHCLNIDQKEKRPERDISPRRLLAHMKGSLFELLRAAFYTMRYRIQKRVILWERYLCRVFLCLCCDICSKVDESWTDGSEWDLLLCCEFRKPSVGFTSPTLKFLLTKNISIQPMGALVTYPYQQISSVYSLVCSDQSTYFVKRSQLNNCFIFFLKDYLKVVLIDNSFSFNRS